MAEEEFPVLRTVAQARFEYVIAQLEQAAGVKAQVVTVPRLAVVDGKVGVDENAPVSYEYLIAGEIVGSIEPDKGRWWLQQKYAVTH